MIFGKNWMQRMDYKFGRYAIRNLMTIIIFGMGLVFLMDMISPISVTGLFAFSMVDIMRGQVWRLFTFVFIPPDSSYIFIIFALYFYWLMGSTLENEWGSFKFNVFYLCGVLGTLLAGLITGYATNYYLNMSLFFAFAILYPNFQIRLFFILPIKIKYLAYLDAALFAFMLIMNNWPGRVALIISLLNIILFFGGDMLFIIKQAYRRAKWKRDVRDSFRK